MKRSGWIALVLCALALAAGGELAHWASRALFARSGPILFVPKSVGPEMEFWQVVGQGVDAAAKELGVEARTEGAVSETDVDGQIRLVERAIPQKPRAIVLAAADYERLVPVAERIRKAGIPLVLVDSGLKADVADSFVGTDNEAAGRQVAEALLADLPPAGTVAIVSFVKGSSTAMERENGVRSRLGASDVRVLGTLYSDGSPDKAYALTKELLQRMPDLAGIAGLNEPSTVGAARAVQELGAAGRVRLIGFDSSTEEIRYLEEGAIQAIVVQKPFNMGYLAIRTAVDISNGRPVEKRIRTGSVVIDKRTMYSKENQKLLFPFR
jgi:ribose transport system substrate-binding protein